VNAGKSSFINAFSGGIISNTSMQRETFTPIWCVHELFPNIVGSWRGLSPAHCFLFFAPSCSYVMHRYQYSERGTEATISHLSHVLETTHAQNEKRRQKMKGLKEEQVGSVLQLTNDELELPIRHDLKGLTILDFPGLKKLNTQRNTSSAITLL
jgi:hypothetical protein